jgi:hypothetical protein
LSIKLQLRRVSGRFHAMPPLQNRPPILRAGFHFGWPLGLLAFAYVTTFYLHNLSQGHWSVRALRGDLAIAAAAGFWTFLGGWLAYDIASRFTVRIVQALCAAIVVPLFATIFTLGTLMFLSPMFLMVLYTDAFWRWLVPPCVIAAALWMIVYLRLRR